MLSHEPEAVFEFLSDLRNHWRLEPHFLELENMRPEGGRVRVKGPFGLSRVARTSVVSATRPTLLRGKAELGRRTEGAVSWEVAPVAGGCSVRFTAQVVRASLLDRLLLALGGRRWLGLIVHRAVDRLGASISEE